MTTERVFIKLNGTEITEVPSNQSSIIGLKHTNDNGDMFITFVTGDREDQNFINERFNFITYEYIWVNPIQKWVNYQSGQFKDNSMIVDNSTIVDPQTGNILKEGDEGYETGITEWQFIKSILVEAVVYPMIESGLKRRLNWN
jgi:hypothetical protein